MNIICNKQATSIFFTFNFLCTNVTNIERSYRRLKRHSFKNIIIVFIITYFYLTGGVFELP
jgi:hypothetical protein